MEIPTRNSVFPIFKTVFFSFGSIYLHFGSNIVESIVQVCLFVQKGRIAIFERKRKEYVL
ncbi:hypothetical protein BSU00_01725 [Tenacibaculum sp. SG-28]|nr:hypothetical protein BSU00_01725 [Tenacibaculum sp. SG-28]